MTAPRLRTALLLVSLALACGGSDPSPKQDAAGVEPADAAGPGGHVTGGPDGATMCSPVLPRCAPSAAGACDHVCQARCGCQQRCAFVAGMAACVPPAPTPVHVGGACSANLDDCAAGAVCLDEASPACQSHCYRYCRIDTDCAGGARCTIDVEVGGATVAKACSVPPEDCDPTGEAPCLAGDRPAPTFGCYVVSAAAPDKAVCDCAGNRKQGQSCMFEHECSPGLECVRVGGGAGACRRVCRLGLAGGCPNGSACTPLGTAATPSTVFGYCSI